MSPKDEPLTIRFSSDDREMLQTAAALRGESESAFVRAAAVDAARALAGRTAWQRALDRFQDAYGSEFDPADKTDTWLIGQLVEEEVRRELTARLTNAIDQATERIKAVGETPP